MADDTIEIETARGMAPQEEQRHAKVEGHAVRVVSYAVRDRYAARVESVDSGEIVGRARGATREEAEGTAIASASVKLGLFAARTSLQKSREQLRETPAERDEG